MKQTFKYFLMERAPTETSIYDDQKGAGAVPYNQDVDYFGLRAITTPRKFLEMASELDRKNASSVDGLKKFIEAGGKIGTPFLEIEVETKDGNLISVPEVKGHEGRNRAYAIAELYGMDSEMKVHIFPRGGLRTRDISKEMKKNLLERVRSEATLRIIREPFSKIL